MYIKIYGSFIKDSQSELCRVELRNAPPVWGILINSLYWCLSNNICPHKITSFTISYVLLGLMIKNDVVQWPQMFFHTFGLYIIRAGLQMTKVTDFWAKTVKKRAMWVDYRGNVLNRGPFHPLDYPEVLRSWFWHAYTCAKCRFGVIVQFRNMLKGKVKKYAVSICEKNILQVRVLNTSSPKIVK